jgi:hypothetical protein
VLAETERVLAPGGRISIYDEFVPSGTKPSLLRRAINPLARLVFSDLTRSLEPLVAPTGLELGEREPFLGGRYTVTSDTVRSATRVRNRSAPMPSVGRAVPARPKSPESGVLTPL